MHPLLAFIAGDSCHLPGTAVSPLWSFNFALSVLNTHHITLIVTQKLLSLLLDPWLLSIVWYWCITIISSLLLLHNCTCLPSIFLFLPLYTWAYLILECSSRPGLGTCFFIYVSPLLAICAISLPWPLSLRTLRRIVLTLSWFSFAPIGLGYF